MKEPPKPPPDPAEELLREWPELQAFGVEWVRKLLILRERLIKIAKALKRFPWMVEVVKQRPMSIPHPYMVEVYVARDGSETCLSLDPPKAYCARDGAARRQSWSWNLSDMRHTKRRLERYTDQRDYWPTPQRRGS